MGRIGLGKFHGDRIWFVCIREINICRMLHSAVSSLVGLTMENAKGPLSAVSAPLQARWDLGFTCGTRLTMKHGDEGLHLVLAQSGLHLV